MRHTRMEKPEIDFDEKLINEIRKHPLIYDPALEDYRSLRKKERAWQMVSRRVNLNLALCRKRWRGLRDCYMRCKRLAATGAKQKWKYMKPMSFLDKVASCRRSAWNATKEYEKALEEQKSADSISEDERTMQAVEDENAAKTLDDYFEHEPGDSMEFIETDDYRLPKIELPLLLELESKDISFEEKLIEEVRQQKCLYDPCSPDYGNKVVKVRVWEEIANHLESTDDVCRKLWRTLRNTYYKTLERAKDRSGAAAERKKRWKYFENMNFLDYYAESKRLCAAMRNINNTEDSNDHLDFEVPEERTLNSEDLETQALLSQSLDPLDQSTSSECSTSGRKQKADSKQKDSTTLLFESLDRNIKEANLSAKQRLDMESSIAALVYSKLLNYNN